METKQKTSKLKKILLGTAVLGVGALGSVDTATETFEGTLSEVNSVRGSGAVYTFDNGKTLQGSYDMQTGTAYEVTKTENLLWPDNVSYKKLN